MTYMAQMFIHGTLVMFHSALVLIRAFWSVFSICITPAWSVWQCFHSPDFSVLPRSPAICSFPRLYPLNDDSPLYSRTHSSSSHDILYVKFSALQLPTPVVVHMKQSSLPQLVALKGFERCSMLFTVSPQLVCVFRSSWFPSCTTSSV